MKEVSHLTALLFVAGVTAALFGMRQSGIETMMPDWYISFGDYALLALSVTAVAIAKDGEFIKRLLTVTAIGLLAPTAVAIAMLASTPTIANMPPAFGHLTAAAMFLAPALYIVETVFGRLVTEAGSEIE